MTRARARKTEWGTVKKRTRAGGIRYWAGEPIGKNDKGEIIYRGSPEGTYTSKSAAQAWLNKRRVERDGERQMADAAKMDATFGYWLDIWLENHRTAWVEGRLSPKGWDAVEINYRNWVTQIEVGGKMLTDIQIRKVDVELLKKAQGVLRVMRGPRGKLSPSQSQRSELTIYSVLKLAAEEGAIPRNPFTEKSKIQVNNQTFHRELGELTAEQVAMIADAVPPEYRLAIFLWAYTGLRAGEVWGLQIKDLHVDRKRIAISRQLVTTKDQLIRDDRHVYKTGEAHPVGVCLSCPEGAEQIPFGTRIRLGLELRPPKPKRAKTLDLHSFVIEELRKHLMLRKPTRPDDWLFVDQHQRRGGGLPVNHGNWYSYYFTPTIRELELDESIDVHTLRHFCGSYHLMLGYPEYVVQTMLDHSSAEMTRLYSHIVEGMAAKWHAKAEADYAERKAV